MKLIVRSSSLLLAFIGIIGNAKMARAGGVLRRGVVGRLRIGMKLDEAMGQVPRDWAVRREGEALSVYPGTGSESPAIIGDITNGCISQFQVISDSFHTDVGIGVGSTLPELGRYYEISWREQDFAYVEALHMRFEIREGKVATILVS